MSERVYLLTNAAATGAAQDWPGGYLEFICSGTFGGATVTLQTLGPDDATWVAVDASTTLTAAGEATVLVARGRIRALVAGGAPAALYAVAALARAAVVVDPSVLATAGATAIAASSNAVTIAAQTWIGLATATTAQIANKTHAINTTGKSKGKHVYDTTADLIVFALGATDTSKWRLTGAVDSTGDVTPS